MLFTRHDDGSTTVDSWSALASMTEAFLDAADKAIVGRTPDTVRITVQNGWALYELVGPSPLYPGAWRYQLVDHGGDAPVADLASNGSQAAAARQHSAGQPPQTTGEG